MEPRRDDQLAADLRALRPTPHPEFAAELDRRAAAGFPRRSRLLPKSPPDLLSPMRNKGRAHRWRRWLVPAGGVAVVLIAAAIGLVATRGGSDSETGGSFLSLYDEGSGSSESAPPAEDLSRPSAGDASAAEEAGNSIWDGVTFGPAQPAGGPARHRVVERSAQMVLAAEPADVADDVAKVLAAVHAHRGIVLQSSTEEGSDGDAGANFELLIPSRELGDALAAFSEIDEVRSREETTADITAPTVTTAELLRESRARIDSLLGQLEEAETESEREAVEAELRQERRHRSRLRSDLQNLKQRANLSGVSLRIETGPSEDSTGGAWGIDDALGDAGHVLAIAAAVAVVALAILGPIALVALLAWLTHRAWVRRERRRVLS
ncbi:MAG TPA: DUF4349 domain-containing protein [Solirubrobacterales bacterium]|nr:DUF4349 domain-containing protein [Solirubrobacterales bacterium]